ncbi:hypothetical protein A2U01_0016473 [Trifolium medium]|uniref:Uncharacterized protein n=1 Tax=Trifolium medium TaxID=97028 RepID=A0A392NAJ6_9FABA|nr:hypothetical protein [Trifolium medium]
MWVCLDEYGEEHYIDTDLARYERDFLPYSWKKLVRLYDLKDQDQVVFDYKGSNGTVNQFVIHAEKLPELGKFTTIHVPDTNCGEVDPKFATKFSGVLPSIWEVYVKNGKDIKLDYNQNCDHPLLRGNWSRLREIYKFKGVTKLSFTYVGTNKFRLSILDQIKDPNLYPEWHMDYITRNIYPD